MLKIVTSFIAVVAIGVGIVITYVLHSVPEKPNLDLNKWWGIGTKPRQEDEAVRLFNVDFNETVQAHLVHLVHFAFRRSAKWTEFEIDVLRNGPNAKEMFFRQVDQMRSGPNAPKPAKMIQDLKQRIKNRRPLTKPLEGIQSEYGMNSVYLESVLDYWIEKYDFKGRAALLNKFPHYKTRIQGLDIHFMRVKPQTKGQKVLPLLMLHGWPSSSKEFDKVIPILTTPKEGYDFVFEVIAADLPGFGFSEGTNKLGLNPAQIGIIMRNLMRRLGFEKFYIQAGDWGSQCATHMATLFPEEILGFHSNMPLSSMTISTVKLLVGSLFPSLIVDSKYVDRIYPLSNLFKYIARESGYFHIQATKPDTIGVALTDSPSGLASYIVEKMAVCSNRDQLDTPHGGIENLSIDDVLDTITIIWANNCIVTASRIYAGGFKHPEVVILHNIPTPVPTAAINFKYEVLYQPDWILRDKFHNLVRSTTLDVGGHFAALHTPQMLADDVYESGADFLKFHEQLSKKK